MFFSYLSTMCPRISCAKTQCDVIILACLRFVYSKALTIRYQNEARVELSWMVLFVQFLHHILQGTRRKLHRVNLTRKDIWDCYQGLTGASPLTIPEVFAKVNPLVFPSCL